MPHDPYKALYLHIPFCKSRCGYCDFRTRAINQDDVLIDQYIENLILEIRRLAKAEELGSIETIYIGGGTPTHIGSARLSSLLYALSLSVNLTKEEDVEFTLEANPESVNERLIKDVWALGVNRLSLGVQSFDDNVLKILGRAHSANEARCAIGLAQERFENVSIDLMGGIPGQSISSFKSSLQEAIDFNLPHISIYPLSIEPYTPFDKLILSGQMEEPDPDIEAEIMLLASEMLQKAGYRRYEVASYAKPGFESKHNSSYWSGVSYLGLGEGATTMTQNEERRMRVCDGQVTDDLNRKQMEAEDLMLAMRKTSGITVKRLEVAKQYLPKVEQELTSLIEDGYVIYEDDSYRPTAQGWLCGNDLYGRLLDLGE